MSELEKVMQVLKSIEVLELEQKRLKEAHRRAKQEEERAKAQPYMPMEVEIPEGW